MAKTSLQELSKQYPQLLDFEAHLFSDRLKDQDRMMYTQEESKRINEHIALFLQHISPLILQTNALHLMEWLIRRFKVNELNVEQVIGCILPYHETPLFVKFVQILAISKESRWFFLKNSVQQTKIELHRDVIVERCAQDPSVLEFIMVLYRKSLELKVSHKTLASFYVTVVMQYLVSFPNLDNNQILQVLPQVMSGLESTDLDERSASQMILALLSRRVQFEEHVLQSLLRSLTKNLNKHNTRPSLTTIIVVLQTQQKLDALPQECADAILLSDQSAKEIINISEEFETENLVQPLLNALFQNLIQNKHQAQTTELMTKIFFETSIASNVVKQFLLDNIPLLDNETASAQSQLIQSLHNKYFKEMDAQSDKKQKKKLFGLVSQTLQGTISEAFEPAKTTLYLALQHPQAEIRLQALERLEELLDSTLEGQFGDILADRLRDEDPKVVLFALEMPQLSTHVEKDRLKHLLCTIIKERHQHQQLVFKALSTLLSLVPEIKKLDESTEIILSHLLLTSTGGQLVEFSMQYFAQVLSLVGVKDTKWIKSLSEKGDPETVISAANTKLITILAKQEKLKQLFVEGLNGPYARMRILSLLVLLKMNQLDHSHLKSVVGLNLHYDQELTQSEDGLPTQESMKRLVKSSHHSAEKAMVQFALFQLASKQTSYELFNLICSIQKTKFRDHLLQFFLSKQQVVDYCTLAFSRTQTPGKIIAMAVLAQVIEKQQQEKTFRDYQLLLPTVILGLSDPLRDIRKQASALVGHLEVGLNKLIEKESKKSTNHIYGAKTFYGPETKHVQYLTLEASFHLTSQIAKRRAECEADEHYLMVNLPLLLEGPKGIRTDFLQFLVSNIFGFTEQSQVRLLNVYSYLDSPEKMRTLEPLLVDGLSKPWHVELLSGLARAFTTKSLKSLFKSQKLFKYFLEMLSTEDVPQKTLVCKSCLDLITTQWFSSLEQKHQIPIVSRLLDIACTTDLGSLAKEKMSQVSIPSAAVNAKLQELGTLLISDQPAKRQKQEGNQDVVLNTLEQTLELVQYATIVNGHLMLVHLMETLNSLLNFNSEETIVSIEYCKQMILSACIELVQQDKKLDTEQLRVDLIVQCIRVTNNPQTHNSALLLLSAIGSRFPDLVLVNIMPVFTFMGANVLRQDDNYSFHVVEKTLETVLPALLERDSSQVDSIIKVFVNAVHHVPAHRRHRLFTILVKTLGTDSHLGQLLALLTTLLIRQPPGVHVGEPVDTVKFSLSLLHSFGPESQLRALLQLLNLVQIDLVENDSIFDRMDERTGARIQKQLLYFVQTALKSKPTIQAIRSEEDLVQLHVELVNVILDLMSKRKDPVLSDCLHSANIVLSLPAFLQVVLGLLDILKKEAMTMLEERVKTLDPQNLDLELFDPVYQKLIKIVQNDTPEHKQLGLICLSVMATILGPSNPEPFQNILSHVQGCLQGDQMVVSTCIVSISAFSGVLGPRMVPLIPKIMPQILDFASSLNQDSESSVLFLSSTLGALGVMIENIPQFLSQFVPRIIMLMISPQVQKAQSHLSQIIGTKIEHRLLFPHISKNLKAWISLGPLSFVRLLKLIDTLLQQTKSSVVLDARNDWMKLFIQCFEFRSLMPQDDKKGLEITEQQLISTFTQYTLKMNEKVFKPLFVKISDWALAKNATKEARMLLFKLVDALLNTLKSIFVPYLSLVFDGCCEQFTTQERFEKIMPLLVDQAEKQIDQELLLTSVVPCIGALASARHQEDALKQLNKRIMLKMRHEEPEVKIVAIQMMSELYTRVGDEMLNCFPETIPYLAELMEDDDEEVERQCQDLCAQIQDYLGEPIQQYFNK
ncbi:armadillo-type protein [Gorgonomyces haynaldii]|nr:armadillo-type protein [Gorgonomyces haynaldii]